MNVSFVTQDWKILSIYSKIINLIEKFDLVLPSTVRVDMFQHEPFGIGFRNGLHEIIWMKKIMKKIKCNTVLYIQKQRNIAIFQGTTPSPIMILGQENAYMEKPYQVNNLRIVQQEKVKIVNRIRLPTQELYKLQIVLNYI